MVKLKSSRRIIFDWLTKNWFISAVISSAPALVFTFTEIFGVNFGFVDHDGALAKEIVWALFSIFIISVTYTFFLSWFNYYDNQIKSNGQFILKRIKASQDSLVSAKLRRITQHISQTNGQVDTKPFTDKGGQQLEQIGGIFEELRDCLADILGLSLDEITISMIYKIDRDTEWNWLTSINSSNKWKLEELLNDPTSTFRQIIDGKTTSIFYASKITAIKEGKYKAGPKDNANNRIGSVICRDISIDHNNSINAILGISTHGHQICEETDEDAKRKVLTDILPSFENQIKIELASFYVNKHLHYSLQ